VSQPSRLVFKRATEPWEFEQIHKLNYATFVEEIPQHEPNAEHRLVDGMLDRSECFICLDGEKVVGMVAVCGERPFSLDRKLRDLDRYLPQDRHTCEVRLLAVDKTYRTGLVFVGLMGQVARYCEEHDYDMVIASATEHQWPMYRRGGGVEFGPLLGTPEARFRGMYITREHFPDTVRRLLRERQSDERSAQP